MDEQVTIVMIQRFFNNECSEEEAKLVASYLKENNDVLKAYLPDETLQQAEITNELSDGKKKQLLQNVTRNIEAQRRKVYFKRAGLAAAIVLGVFFAGKLLSGDFNSDNEIFAVSQSSPPIKRIENNTGKSQLVRLPDGTKVSLMSGAAIEFSKEFNENRNIVLTGKAFFEVAHDEKHPFSVDANGISTTALGTQFWVDENKNRGTINVSLVEGSVVVETTQKARMKKIYLVPGQQLSIDLESAIAILSGPDPKGKTALLSVDSANNNGVVVKENGVRQGKVNWGNIEYSFSGQSLSQVFKRIEKRYGITIAFKDAEIENYRFTGKVMYKDSLDMVMRHLCRLYDLQYTQEENNITIEKLSGSLSK